MQSTAQSDAPRPGEPSQLEPGIRRILAPNPSPMTFWGTNSYLLGEGEVALIDPGPAIPAHVHAILAALRPGERLGAILVTHAHLDHAPLAPALAEATGAKVFAFGDALAGRTEVMQQLAQEGLLGGGEGVDLGFRPDERLADGETLSLGGLEIEALWTPGHMANHLSFAAGGAVFSGDVMMGWASTMISPPDGDVTAFRVSMERLAARGDRVAYPGHGAPIAEPTERARALIAHRQTREQQILAGLDATPVGIPELTGKIYHDVAPMLLPAAERNVLAHLIDLVGRGLVATTSGLSVKATFFLK
jgi:glyoxylase-like metal-dependent hydrolase (beta-lactamase superfamily II)